MEFEWDDNKNQYNFEKHGITFEEACEIFHHPTFSVIDDRQDYGEVREKSIGMIGTEVVIAIIHTDRNGKVRLISARRANTEERKMYHGYIKKTFKGN
ncbi:MAG: BrnT family toxin [Pseudomonadota bacterium]